MRVVHYTDLPFQLRPISIKNGDGKTGLFIKPCGGLWCSPLDSKWDWSDWCRSESYGDIDNQSKVILDIDTTNLVIIDCIEDMETKLSWYMFHDKFEAIDFENMVRKGIDGIYLTEKGQEDTRWSRSRSLYGWDCETVLILNERCVNAVEVVKNECRSVGLYGVRILA